MKEYGTNNKSFGMKNTVGYQLSKLTEDEMRGVVNNTEPGRLEAYMDVQCYTVGMALCYLFKWQDEPEKGLYFTPEREAYWRGVVDKYREVKWSRSWED